MQSFFAGKTEKVDEVLYSRFIPGTGARVGGDDGGLGGPVAAPVAAPTTGAGGEDA